MSSSSRSVFLTVVAVGVGICVAVWGRDFSRLLEPEAASDISGATTVNTLETRSEDPAKKRLVAAATAWQQERTSSPSISEGHVEHPDQRVDALETVASETRDSDVAIDPSVPMQGQFVGKINLGVALDPDSLEHVEAAKVPVNLGSFVDPENY